MFNALTRLFKRSDPIWEQFQQEASRKAMFTPDILTLQENAHWNIFLYNECQQGQPKNDVMSKTSTYGGLAYTENSDFVLYKKLLGNETFPIAFEIKPDQKMGMSSLIGDPGQIVGQVFTVQPFDIVALDNYLLNTVYFERKRVPVVIPYKTDAKAENFETQRLNVWMWIARPEFWNEQLFSGEGKKLFERSQRLFNVKNSEPLGAHYLFDWNVEAPPF